MGKIDPHKTGLVLGALIGGWHLVWSQLVALGWAQALLDIVFWMHRIEPVFVVAPFRFEVAALLLVTTSVIGYVFGIVAAAVWNSVHRPVS